METRHVFLCSRKRIFKHYTNKCEASGAKTVNNTCCVERQLLHANTNSPKDRVNISSHWNEQQVCLAKCVYSAKGYNLGEGELCVKRWDLIKSRIRRAVNIEIIEDVRNI
jgi:hypothetical protein